jgi:hypothetical protein
MIPKREKVPNGHKIYQMSVKKAIKHINSFQPKATPKFSQIGILGLKINHLATLMYMLPTVSFFLLAHAGVARFFWVKHTKKGKN